MGDGSCPILWIVAYRVPPELVIEEAERMGIAGWKLNDISRARGEELRARCLERMGRSRPSKQRSQT